jgi:hypothetical protein
VDKTVSWAEKKRSPVAAIPAGTDANGDVWVRSGVADPWARLKAADGSMGRPSAYDPEKKKVEWQGEKPDYVEPTPVFQRLLGMDQEKQDELGTGAWDQIAAGFNSPLATMADVVNDVNTRVGNARRWRADDPYSKKDEPVFEYETPSGQKFTTDQQQAYFKLSDGTVLSQADYDGMKADETTYRLKNGMEITKDEFEQLKPGDVEWTDKKDKRWDGKTVDTAGTPVIVNSYELPSGKVISAEAISEPTVAYFVLPDGRKVSTDVVNTGEYTHTAFPDGTITGQASGEVPEEARDLAMRQVGKRDMTNPEKPGEVRPVGAAGVAGMGVLDTVESPELHATSAAAVRHTAETVSRFLTSQPGTGAAPARPGATRRPTRIAPQ